MKKLKALIEKHNDNLEAMGKMLDTSVPLPRMSRSATMN